MKRVRLVAGVTACLLVALVAPGVSASVTERKGAYQATTSFTGFPCDRLTVKETYGLADCALEVVLKPARGGVSIRVEQRTLNSSSVEKTYLGSTSRAGASSIALPTKCGDVFCNGPRKYSIAYADARGRWVPLDSIYIDYSSGGASNRSTPPDDVTEFYSAVQPSLTTVFCGRSLGTGWAVDITLSDEALAQGYRSYIITNFHVVEDCAYNLSVGVSKDFQIQPGLLWAWSEEHDIAAIMTAVEFPTLPWNPSPKPKVGQWAAAFGSPYGYEGSMTVGAVSNVSATELVSSAPINPGNSGGPLMDNQGRVVAINTASFDGASSFSIAQGTPLLCDSVILCRGLPWQSSTWRVRPSDAPLVGRAMTPPSAMMPYRP